MSADVESELAELREEFETLKESLLADRQSFRENVFKPKMQELETRCDDAREQREEHQEELDQLRSRVTELEAKMDSVVGLAEGERGTPQKRSGDLRLGLIRRAKARSGVGEGKAAMHWQDVQDFFAETGYGEVKKPECYKAMSDAAEAEGFVVKDDAKELRGRMSKAIRVELSALPENAELLHSSNPTTGGTTQGEASADD